MSRWVRLASPRRCGNCGERIAVGEPAMLLQGRPPATWKSYRCGQFACARESIPEQLPELVERPPVAMPSTFLKVGPDMLPLDFKQRAGGES